MDSILMGDSPMRDSRAILEPGTPGQSHMALLARSFRQSQRILDRDNLLFRSE